MMRQTLVRLALLATVLWLLLSSASCNGNVYVGVAVPGPYVGYPYGHPHGPYPYGRPIRF
jgi:hypothetical protein